jgi:long-chain acyl-CoA synthetase
MFVELLRRQRSQPRTVDSLEFCGVAGDVCPAKVQESFPDVFGVPLRTVWGATEVAGSLIHGLKPGPVSRIAPGAEVRLVDDNGMQVSRGEVGEMLIRGPNVAIGYWVDPDRIDPATVGGWYATGDLMRQGEQDDLWFIARKKDLIIRGGSNIWPAEVDRASLRSLPAASAPERALRRVAPMWVALALTLGALAPNAWAAQSWEQTSVTVH